MKNKVELLGWYGGDTINACSAWTSTSRTLTEEKKNRIPKWVDKDHMWLIKEVYELAQIRTKEFGFPWHVDHIIPLQGELVSGLHVIENLQVLPGVENIKKKNKYEIDHA